MRIINDINIPKKKNSSMTHTSPILHYNEYHVHVYLQF